MTALINNDKNFESIHNNFKIIKNIPIDTRYLINSINTVDVEIPINLRYPGLIFYTYTQETIYYFKNNLTFDLLSNLLTLSDIRLLEAPDGETDYSELGNALSAISAKDGSIITVVPLNVSFIVKGGDWEYFTGIYNLVHLSYYDTIPNHLRKPEILVNIGNTRYLINNDLSLSEELITLSSPPGIIQNDRYYNIDGILYYAVNNQLYRVGEKLYNSEILVNIGNTTITHNLNSTNILHYFRIYNNNNICLPNNTLVNLDLKPINNNQVVISSKTELIGNLILMVI